MLNNKTVLKIVNVLRIIATIILIFLLLNTILQRFMPQDSNLIKYRTYNIVTRSMEPELIVGDIILVKKVDPKDINVGDNITFQGTLGDMKGKTITHEVINIRQEQGKYVFTTQGKSNLSIDPEVWEQLVFGKVVYKFKILSFLSRLIKTWYGFLFIVAIPLITLLYTEIKEMRKEIKERLD